MYSCSATLTNISLKNSFENVVFQILVTLIYSRNENPLFGRHFETFDFVVVVVGVVVALLWLS